MPTLKLAVLRNELEYLQKWLGDPCRYLRAIRNEGYLTEEECQRIKSRTTNPERIELLISILCRQNCSKAFDVFVSELRKQRVDDSIAVHLKREAASKWLCYHCKSLNQLQLKKCQTCDLPKTCTDLMDNAVSKDSVQNQPYKCSRCETDVEIASLPANRQLDAFKVCYKCLKQENPETASGIVQMYQHYYHTGGDKPLFVEQPPREMSVHAGEDLILRCRATGNPPPKYQWFNDQRNPLEGKDQPTLVIENVTQAVQGYFICRAVSCSDSKCADSSCCTFSEWTNVIVSSPLQPDQLKPREPPDHSTSTCTSQSSKAEANPPMYLQQLGQYVQQPLPVHPHQLPQAKQQQQLSSQVQNVKSEVIRQPNVSFHSQANLHVRESHMHMPTLQSWSEPHHLSQETQHKLLARGSSLQSGSPPQFHPPIQRLSQSYMPPSKPIGLLHQQWSPSQPNEQSPARMCLPGQLQQPATVHQTQHQAQALQPQFTRPQDLPLQPAPLHIQPPMQQPPNSPQTQLLSHSKSICHPNAQQVSSLPPQQNLQDLPDLEQFNSPPPKPKPVPKPRKNLQRSSGLLKSDSTPTGTPITVPGPEMLHGTHRSELPGTISQPSTYDAITLECDRNPPTPKSKKLLDDALKDGFILADITNVLCIGSAGVGKSHLKFLLLRKRPPFPRCSTRCAEAAIRVVACSRMTADQHDELHEVSLDELRIWLAQSASTGVTLEHHSPATHSQKTELVNSSDIQSDPENLPTENPQSSCSSSSSPSIVKPDEPTGLAETYRILQLMNRHVLQDNDEFGLKHIHWVHFVDSGGQPQFHEVLPAFIRNTSLSLVVFKLSEALSDYPDTEFYTAEQGCIKLGRFSQTNEEIIQHVAKSIQSHQFSSHPGNSHDIHHASQKQPRFMLVGTFKDEEHSCQESLQHKNEKLKSSLRPFEDILIPRSNKEIIFPVNGLLAGPDDQDPVAKELRKAIIGSRQHITAPIPIRWYFLQLEIQALKKKVVTIEECWKIAQKLHFQSRDDLIAALEYIHNLNLIMYFPAVLPNIVFCDPQLLLNKVSQLIEFSFYLSSSKTIQNPVGLTFGMQRRLVEQGTFAPELLDVKSDGYIPGTFSSSELLSLLEHLLLIAKIKEEGKPDEYFMPSLLPLLSSNEISKLSQITADSYSFAKPLVVYFPDGWSPNGLFCAVIVFLLSSENHHYRWKFLTQNRCYNSQLHLKNGRNFAKFGIEGYHGVVTIINSGRYFEVHTTCPGNLCPVIKHCIFEGIHKVHTRFTYSFKCGVGFFCPCGSPLHIAELGTDHSLICTRNRAIAYGELTPNYTIWLKAHMEGPGTLTSGQIERDAPPDLRALMNHVSTRTTKWREVGIELGISIPKLDAISLEVRTVQRCFEQVFEHWKRSTSMPYTWDTIITALKAQQVNEQRLASEIEHSLTL